MKKNKQDVTRVVQDKRKYERVKFVPGKNGVVVPCHNVPKLHEDATLMSFRHTGKIHKTYKEVMGTRGISHFSINIVDPTGNMSIVSFSPHIAFNILNDGTYLYNGSISSTYYKNRDFYSWDESYDPRFKVKLLNNMERKNGIQKGIVIIRRLGRFILLYSFATKLDPVDFTSDISENRSDFYKIGDHCYSLIQSIYDPYSKGYGAPRLNQLGVIDGGVNKVDERVVCQRNFQVVG